MRFFACFLFCVALFVAKNDCAQTWTNVGTTGFSSAEADYTNIAIDTGGKPYVVYMDYSNNKRATVMKYSGGSWVNVGTPGFSTGTAYNTDIAIDMNGTPYVVYMDGILSDELVVKKFNGSAWVNVGTPGFSVSEADYSTIAIDTGGTPYVAFEDYANNEKATVMKYTDTGWAYVGAPGFSDSTVNNIVIAIDGTGTPYVVYQDFNYAYGATVKKFNGTSWVTVGTEGFTSGEADYLSIALSAAGTPYVVYNDPGMGGFMGGGGGGATVRTYNGSSWVALGTTDFSGGPSEYTTIAIGKTGIPYVAYADAAGMGGMGGFGGNTPASVMSYSSSWANVGVPDFSVGGAAYTDIAIDSSGDLYVVYQDQSTTSNAATVMEYKVMTSGVKNIMGASATLTVFPDPNNGSFTIGISAQQSEDVAITITNAVGQKVKEFTTTTNMITQVQLDAPAGMYFISAVTKEGLLSRKIVVE